MRTSLHRFLRAKDGNVAMIFAISLVPLMFLTGMGVDYGSAAMREAQLNSIADSASLAAVTPAAMASNDAASVTAATNYFNAQATALQGVNYKAGNLTVTVTDSITTRQVQVSFTATSQNFFPSILGRSTIALSGSSTAVGSVAPNIDFYMLLDDSPSMAIPATQSGINSMVSLTASYPSAYQNCAFACHEVSTSTGKGTDLYGLARSNSITLRIDNVRTAMQDLTSTAQTTEQTYSSTYRMAVYTFDYGFNTIGALTSNLSTVNSESANIQLFEVYNQSHVTQTVSNDDEDTNFDNAMNQVNTIMPAPGNGTNASGDKPEEILFLVTDGVIDENPPTSPSLNSAYGTIISGPPSRQQSTIIPLNGSGQVPSNETDWCTKIKNRGIRIAVLYTAYYPLPSNNWYNTYLAPIQPNIGTQLQNCASPGLYKQVSTGGDISAAMGALFQLAVATAHLLK